jgi:hypothetical protein
VLMGAVRLALVQIEDILRSAVQSGGPLPPPTALVASSRRPPPKVPTAST